MDIQFDPTIVAVILGLVQYVKSLGVTGKASQVASMGLGLVIGAAHQVSVEGQPSDFQGWFLVLVVGLAHGLAASGLYDFAKTFRAQS